MKFRACDYYPDPEQDCFSAGADVMLAEGACGTCTHRLLVAAWEEAHDVFCAAGLVCSVHGRPGERLLMQARQQPRRSG